MTDAGVTGFSRNGAPQHMETGAMIAEKYQLLPALPPDQFEALKADIAERGVIVPVIVEPMPEGFKTDWAAFLARRRDCELPDVVKELEILQQKFAQARAERRLQSAAPTKRARRG